jgi:hypothetical protein
VLSALVDYGAQMSSLNMMHQTCLHLTTNASYLCGVRTPLEKGCDITFLDIHGLSPVQYDVLTTTQASYVSCLKVIRTNYQKFALSMII